VKLQCNNNQFTGKEASKHHSEQDVQPRCVLYLECDLTGWLLIGQLASFAQCEKLEQLECFNNQFTGTQIKSFFSGLIECPLFVAGELPSFANCKKLTTCIVTWNQFTGMWFQRIESKSVHIPSTPVHIPLVLCFEFNVI
jgi:hypothetical protein